MTTRQAKGAAGEDRAADFLTGRGLRVVERNFRVRGGEIDLICHDGKSVVFVEVRLRSGMGYGGAGASITTAKQARLVLAARHWLVRNGDRPCRFDCVLIQDGKLEWIKDAFRPH
jgi:putative endonuclease